MFRAHGGTSGTKGGWISAPILCWEMVSLTRYPTYTKQFIVLAVMVTGAFLVWYFSIFIQQRVGNIPLAVMTYLDTGQVTDGSASIRLALWHAATLVFIDNPLFGVALVTLMLLNCPIYKQAFFQKLLVSLMLPIVSFLIRYMNQASLVP
jgi:O-antigen ligase